MARRHGTIRCIQKWEPNSSQPKQAPRQVSPSTTQLANNTPEKRSRPQSARNLANGSGESQQIADAANAVNNRLEPSETTVPPRENLTPLERELASVGGQVRMGVGALRNILGTLTGRTRSAPETPNFGQLQLKYPPINESKPVKGDAPPQFLLEESKPVFAWMPVNDATTYRVALREASANEPIEVLELAPDQTEYRVALSLNPEKTYELTVEAIRGRAKTLRGTLRFTVMSETQRQNLKFARQNLQEAPLVSGVLLYELQRYKEALEAFEAAQQRYPEDEQIQHAVKRLRALVNR